MSTDPAQIIQQGKVFPLVLSPVENGMNFVQLQEYFIEKHDFILQAASEYGAVLFSGFDLRSGEEWASVLSKTGCAPMDYTGGTAVRKLIVGSEDRL